jgi:histidine kinase/DNA gyrase B/HSP90-like ATPase
MTSEANNDEKLFVKSHVARDLLQNAAVFKNEKLVIWEYVSNGLEYIDEDTNPVVRVRLDSKNKMIIITDNGRGMDWEGLKNFFVMHGENIDRLQGRPGRGRFGTGKSAAFGIADKLRVTTVRNGFRSAVELTRDDISKMSSQDPIPVRVMERETSTNQPNGTKIEIIGIHLRSLHQAGVIQYIERHLAKWRNSTVFVNNHECEVSEPPAIETRIFRTEGKIGEILGDVELKIKIAGSPLGEDDRGVSIFSNGIWHETTLAGSEGREMAQYIFGEIDVPKLDEDKSPMPPFDLTRSMRLNQSNEMVQCIYGFIGHKIDEVRRELVRSEKERKRSEEAKKLAGQADSIAQECEKRDVRK